MIKSKNDEAFERPVESNECKVDKNKSVPGKGIQPLTPPDNTLALTDRTIELPLTVYEASSSQHGTVPFEMKTKSSDDPTTSK